MPLIVIGLVVIIVFLAGRPKTETAQSDEPPSGAELIERLQHTLGIAIVVESVESIEAKDSSESADTVTIRAAFISGRHSTRVAVAGPTESDAWAAFAREAVAWRNSDFQHVPMWPGGG